MNVEQTPFGGRLRQWRERRRMTQADLAFAATSSTRHLSCLETGRAQPSREMIARLAECLDIPLRDQNVLLKIAEEGPAYAAFLFCAETAAALLPTVRSRCVEWKVAGQPETPEMEQARGLCRVLAQGKTLPAAQWLVSLENRRIKREQLQELLQDAWLLTAQALLLQAGKPEDGTLPEEAELLSRSLSSRRLEGLSALLRQYSAECAYNVGAGHVLGALCAQWERLLHATR